MRYLRRHFRKVSLAAVAAVIMLSGMAAASQAQAAPAMNTTGSGCNFSTLAHWYNCTTVNGSGLKINFVSGYAVDGGGNASFPSMHVEVYGPNGHIANCGTFTLGASQGTTGPICKWTNPSPGATMRAGDYCTVTWQSEGGGNFREGGPECVNVHA
jgi:hypothetical protein